MSVVVQLPESLTGEQLKPIVQTLRDVGIDPSHVRSVKYSPDSLEIEHKVYDDDGHDIVDFDRNVVVTHTVVIPVSYPVAP